jgi:mRNA deadenylase 3'-5' endonuclease subunit Ccr4
MASPDATMSTFVVSFNVLSSALSQATHFSKAVPEDCLAHNRFKVLTEKLLQYVKVGRIICLQELSREWHASLIPFFRLHGYTIVASLYGCAKNGYMGVAIACKDSLYDIIEVRNQCVADYADWPATRTESASQYWGVSTWTTWTNYFWEQYVRPSASRSISSQVDEVAIAREKPNTLLMLRLVTRGQDDMNEFVVGTYHMPCAYMHRAVMVLHAGAVANQIQEFARNGVSGDAPIILAGDFNMDPDSEEYNLMTFGEVSHQMHQMFAERYPNLPKSAYRLSETMKSAYLFIRGKEPAFTCYATTCYKGVEKDFIGTIDYIFFSVQFTPKCAIAIPKKPLPEYGASLPSAANPSDHIPIGAMLELFE